MNDSNSSENASIVDPYSKAFSTYYVANYIDWSFRIISLLVHIFYAIIVLSKKQLQTRTYVFMHHVNFVSFAYILHFVAFFDTRTASYGQNFTLEVAFCTLSEIFWSLLAYMRTYSILLLALYRYWAVYWIKMYRLINTNTVYIYAAILAAWLGSLLLTLVFKYAFSTTHSVYFCTPGYSDNLLVIVISQCLTNVICNIVPVTLVAVLYARILKKLRESKKNLNRFTRQQSGFSKRKEFELAKQFIFVNTFTILSSVVSIMINLVMVLASYQAKTFTSTEIDAMFIEVRPALRALFIFFQTCLPILSIAYNPEIKLSKKFDKFKNISISIIT
ncbi:hypothetical protein BpHYR1_013244 [Brachionus plicatilis]|uniref:G-protein coupled receptors family 1 profile domain-containing protein n=1 Tax=Brachionus plicatilis TaxID=10195 RepID=A0A3M7S1F6_BRAPC|nr:hypothetical protein BpHYR1_013244 [Brachionus plicatilis]